MTEQFRKSPLSKIATDRNGSNRDAYHDPARGEADVASPSSVVGADPTLRTSLVAQSPAELGYRARTTGRAGHRAQHAAPLVGALVCAYGPIRIDVRRRMVQQLLPKCFAYRLSLPEVLIGWSGRSWVRARVRVILFDAGHMWIVLRRCHRPSNASRIPVVVHSLLWLAAAHISP